MEEDKQGRSTRKRRRHAGSDATPTNESVLSDDTESKHYSIRSRRTRTSNDEFQSGNENEESSPSSSPAVTVVPAHTASPALQQATRELHARIMSRVRDLAPSFATTATTTTATTATTTTTTTATTTTTSTSKPPITPPPTTPPSGTPPSTPIPKATADISPTAIQSTTSPTITNSTNIASKNTTRTVKELQHLISQYLQQQRATLGITTPTGTNASPNSTPRNVPTTPNFSNATNISHITNALNSSTSTISNTSRPPSDVAQNILTSDDTFQKSSIIANKFNSAINKYTRSPHTLNSSTSTTGNIITHSTSTSHNGKPSNLQIVRMGHHESGAPAPRSETSSSRPVVTSVLDKNVPALHIQYKHNQKEKQRRSEYGYYDDTSSSSSEGNSNYFLLAAQHELQNMDEEIAAQEQAEVLEDEIERLQRAVAMRDRVIKKLREEIEEKDAIIRALPYELVSNWVAASRMMMGQ
eukprot:Phypoly_transcript_04299.p1 GENE.Phypoly_transcript_04299~~Phypoly_transcript_04299.p1  ORF type:complete len:471 (+),score=94.00 Phypoly_transcript_04299:633-2045(+)